MSKQLIDPEEIYGESDDRYLNWLIPFILIGVAVAIADAVSGFQLHEWIASLIG